MSRDEALELALASLRDQIRALKPLWEKPSVGLSGGWDSRIVVAALRAEGVSCDLRVRGLPDRPDVRIARQLTEIAQLDLRVKTSSSLPPTQPHQCRAAMGCALLWQAGGMVTRQHKVFLANEKLLDGGRVNVLGQHGEIARGFYPAKIAATDIKAPTPDEGLRQLLLAQTPPAFLPRVRMDIEATVREFCGDADRYGLEGDSRLDYFFLSEDTRRWASASLASLPGVTCAPLLTPGFIRATFALPPAERRAQASHRHIIAACAPDWRDVPFAAAVENSPDPPLASRDWKQPTGRHNYDNLAYWRTVGWPLIEAAMPAASGRDEVFNFEQVGKHWADVPDELVLATLIPEIFPA